VGSSEIFLEEHDYGIDLMTKNQPDPFWHLKDKIKTPVRCKLALQTQTVIGYSPCLEVATCQGGFK
jgi:hypothetical protein